MFKIEKGTSFQIPKGSVNLYIGASWDPQLSSDSEAFDLDLHMFALREGRGYDGDGSHALTYANKRNAKNPDGLLKVNPDESFETIDGSMFHKGDSKTGVGPGDDEYIKIYTDKLPVSIDEIAVWITIHDASARKQNFGRVLNPALHIDDADSKSQLATYNLSSMFANNSCVQIGSFLKDGVGNWNFKGADEGSNATLIQILRGYGLA